MNLEGIHWVIVGGESGHGARLMKRDWVLSIKDLCRAANVPFFFKQWGGVRKSAAGRLLQGRTYDEFPRRIQRPVPEVRKCITLANTIQSSYTTSPSPGPTLQRISL